VAIREIKILPNPVLKKKAKKVSSIDGSIKRLINDMFETMYEAPGVGLAAPQVGVSLRVICIGIPPAEQDGEPEEHCLINPEVVKKKGERVVREGCLSVPGFYAEIKRAEQVTVKGKDRSGKEVRIKAEGLLAQALEHEIDHLNGVLYIDYLNGDMSQLKKVEPEQKQEMTG
jgi:peptide deformylase